MNIKHVVFGGTALGACLLSGIAQAIVISGSYSGIATIVSGPYLETTTEAVTGKFQFKNDPSTCPLPIEPDAPPCGLPFEWNIVGAEGEIASFNVVESIYSYIALTQSADQQSVTLT